MFALFDFFLDELFLEISWTIDAFKWNQATTQKNHCKKNHFRLIKRKEYKILELHDFVWTGTIFPSTTRIFLIYDSLLTSLIWVIVKYLPQHYFLIFQHLLILLGLPNPQCIPNSNWPRWLGLLCGLLLVLYHGDSFALNSDFCRDSALSLL